MAVVALGQHADGGIVVHVLLRAFRDGCLDWQTAFLQYHIRQRAELLAYAAIVLPNLLANGRAFKAFGRVGKPCDAVGAVDDRLVAHDAQFVGVWETVPVAALEILDDGPDRLGRIAVALVGLCEQSLFDIRQGKKRFYPFLLWIGGKIGL